MSRAPAMSQTERTTIALILLDRMNTTDPTSVVELGRNLPASKFVLQKLCGILVKAGLVRSTKGRARGGMKRAEGVSYTRETVEAVLVMAKPPGKRDREKVVRTQVVKRRAKTHAPAGPVTTRRCRICDTKLPKSRYFHCTVCVTSLSDIDDDMIYFYASNTAPAEQDWTEVLTYDGDL